MGNLVVGTATATALLSGLFRPLAMLGLLAIPAMAGMTRMACHAVDGDRVRISQLWAGARHRWAAHLGLGVAQLLLLAVSVVNVRVALAAGSVVGGAAAVVALYVGLAIWTVAIAAWPLLLDPAGRDRSVPQALRTAAVMVLRRPLHFSVLALILGGLVAATVQTVAPIAVVPAFTALTAAHATRDPGPR